MSCKPPYERGHGGYCGCNCKCLAPECWDLIYINYDCNEGASLIPIGEGGILGKPTSCEAGLKICPGIHGESDYCQNENFPCVGYDCQVEGCVKSPYINGMYYTYNDCINYCINQEQRHLKLTPSEIFYNGLVCPNGTCPENPTWICCLDGLHCAATYADCPNCFCEGKQGCTNPHSNNYDPDAKCDDGSCVTCCNAMKCVVDDRDDAANCNRLPLIDGFAGGTDGCCDAFCVEVGDCHPTYTNSHTVPAENSCSGKEFTYNACGTCTYNTTTTTTTTTYSPYRTCYECIYGAADSENCKPVEFPNTTSPPIPIRISNSTTCSDYNTADSTFYETESECRSDCSTATTPYPYKLCYSCLETAIGGNCIPVPISYGDCSDYSVPGNTFYDSPSECDSNCTTTTTTKPPCVVEVTTEGCCLEYSEGTIYAVGDGVVKAVAQDKENCCDDFRMIVNGLPESSQVLDGAEIEFMPGSFKCPCEEISIEPSDPSSASCPPKPAAKPILVLDKKTNKIKILINKNSL